MDWHKDIDRLNVGAIRGSFIAGCGTPATAMLGLRRGGPMPYEWECEPQVEGHFVGRSTLTKVAAQRSRRSNDALNTSMGRFHGSRMARVVSNIGSRSPAITIRSRLTRNVRATRPACSASITITRSASAIPDWAMSRERCRERSRPRCALSEIEICGTGRSFPTKPADVVAMSGRPR